jgi:hypothetical protein
LSKDLLRCLVLVAPRDLNRLSTVPERVEEFCGTVGPNGVLGADWGEDPPVLPVSTVRHTRPTPRSQLLLMTLVVPFCKRAVNPMVPNLF